MSLISQCIKIVKTTDSKSRLIFLRPLFTEIEENNCFSIIAYSWSETESDSAPFRPLHSTVSALIQMCAKWFENMDNGKLTGVVFLDTRKELFKLIIRFYWRKLSFMAWLIRELMWFNFYLTFRQHQCFVNGHLSY